MTKEKKYIGGAFLIGIVYRLLMGLQGIDPTDMGFCMTFYQNIFCHPESMTFYFNYYLTGLIGGLWHLVFGQFGLLGFRILDTITMSAAIWLLYLSFRNWLTTPKLAAIGILLSFLFPSFVITFHYDTLSFLLMTASTYALMRWQGSGNIAWLWTAGVWIGICFFARIVNMSLAVLVILPFLWGVRQSWQKGLTDAAIFGGGIFAGIMAVLLLMAVLGHLPYFAAGLSEAYGTLNGHETSNTSSNLFAVYFKSYINIGLQMLVIGVVAVLYRDAEELSSHLKIAARTLLLAALFVLVITSQPYLSAVAISTLFLLLLPPSAFGLPPLMGYVLVCAYLFPFGSDIGIPGIFHWCGGLLIIPATCCCRQIIRPWQRQVVWGVCLSIAFSMLYKMGMEAKGESASRLSATTVALPGSLNVMTDTERAARYRNEVARICEYGHDNPLLLIGNQASELYYATGKLPFTGNTQMGTFMGAALIERLDMRYKFYRQLPLIAFIMRGHDTDDVPEFRHALLPWMMSHNYHLVYEDQDIEIFTAKK